MRIVSFFALLGALSLVVTGCGADPDHVAQLDQAALDGLIHHDASSSEMRTLLMKRNYACSDASGTFALPDGSHISAERYTLCVKKLRDTLFCDYLVQVALFPGENASSSTSFGRVRRCL
jgi:hypothetical protein